MAVLGQRGIQLLELLESLHEQVEALARISHTIHGAKKHQALVLGPTQPTPHLGTGIRTKNLRQGVGNYPAGHTRQQR